MPWDGHPLNESSRWAPNNAIYGQFFAAVEDGKIQDVKLCLETHDININLFKGENFDGSNALYIAASNGDADMIELLLADGAKVAEFDTTIDGGDTALHQAAYSANVRALRLLLDHRARVDIIDSLCENTPLLAVLFYHYHNDVIESKHREAIKILVERGSDLFAVQGNNGDTVWTQAAALGDVELLQYLLAAGYSINDGTPGEKRWTALAEAVMSQRTKAVKFLVDSGATVYKEIVRMARTVEIFDILRFHVDQQSLEAYGVFQTASANRLPELVLHMISIGMDVNGRHKGVTGLMSAVMRKDSSEVINSLLSKGADVSLQSMDTGDTALHRASYLCDIEVVDILLKASSDVHSVNLARRTPLTSFARAMGTKYGYDGSYRKKSVHSRLESLRLLIQAGSDLNAQDETGRTPLHEVVLTQTPMDPSEVLVRTVAASMLIEVGARTDIPDNDGKIVRDLIMDHTHIEMRTLLSETCPVMDS